MQSHSTGTLRAHPFLIIKQ